MDYRELFQRNYGIFSEDEQERIRRAKVLIVGCGGIGGTVAVILARSGVERFVLCDFDVYSPSNTNRQIACFTDTLGREKSEVVRETILRINPAAVVTAYTELLPHAWIAELMGDADFVFPAADDLAFSIIVFRDAQRLGKPALMVNPAGTWAHVSVILPGAPSIEEIEGVPKLGSYEALRDMLEVRRYKLGTYFYVPFADWRIDYYRKFIEENTAPAQICPTVWMASALGAMETIKVLSGKWQPVSSPRYWHITAKTIRIQRVNGLCPHTLLVWQRRLMWRIFQTPLGPALEWMQGLWWALFQRLMKFREVRQGRASERRGIGGRP
jgi:molybdopterin/thiamine biosynthesis adenylyltransferase